MPMAHQVIRVRLRRGRSLWFCESEDMPSLKLAFPKMQTLIDEVNAVARRVLGDDAEVEFLLESPDA